jgi:hypothetical protein
MNEVGKSIKELDEKITNMDEKKENILRIWRKLEMLEIKKSTSKKTQRKTSLLD